MLIISIVCKISAYCSLFVRIFNKNQKLSDLFYMALSGLQRLLPLWYIPDISVARRQTTSLWKSERS